MAHRKEFVKEHDRRWESNARKRRRFSALGLEMEKRVEGLLQKMKDEGSILSYIHHPRNSLEDRKGNDFTVTIVRGGEKIDVSFGVTISSRKAGTNAKVVGAKDLHFPLNTNDARIQERILQLAQSAQAV